MGCISPGGTEMMARVLCELGLLAGSRVLDIGCGEGDTIAHLADEYGLVGVGVDKSYERIRRGRARHAKLDLRTYDVVSMDGAVKLGSFDTVLIECVLSVDERPFETLERAVRVMKIGGHLLIADLCGREEAARASAAFPESFAADDPSREPRTPRGSLKEPAAVASEWGSGHGKRQPAAIVHDGLVSVHGMAAALQDMGLALVSFEDRSRDLDSFAAEKIFEYGSLEAYYADAVPEGSDRRDFFPCALNTEDPSLCAKGKASRSRPPGYFLSVFRKER